MLKTIARAFVAPKIGIRKFNYFVMSDTQAKANPSGGERRKRENQGGRGQKRQRIQKPKLVKEGSHEEVLIADVRELFAKQRLIDAGEETIENNQLKEGEDPSASNGDISKPQTALPAPFSEIDVKVLEISSTGDGLAVAPNSDQIYIVPFTAPGDTVKVKVIKHFERDHYSLSDFVSVIEPSPLRDDSRINCQYFAKCSGCQFQMLDYATQLKHKKSIVEKAYKNFSQLSPALVPAIKDTMGSPLKYGYRTKLTPHFDGPPGFMRKANARAGIVPHFEEVPPIGFMQKGQRKTIDIEDCPIGTDAVRLGMKRERFRVARELDKYKRGATILLRESTERVPNSEAPADTPPDTIKVTTDDYTDLKTCITDNNATSVEYIDSYIFTNPAGSFFQNNNSILPPFTDYIRQHILPPSTTDSSSRPIKYLIDAYSGSGLFTITLSSLFESSSGIDIAVASIEFASKNAALNSIPPSKASFVAADATELFKSVKYPADETVVVIDPPRKGCDESFLNQLLAFGPRRVIYVSCNVHTQARDVGVLVRGKEDGGKRYEIESLKGFDFFPQTGHVEGVAVLRRVEEDKVDETTEP
jgi:tRNA (uracil-5-)-methyltransferase